VASLTIRNIPEDAKLRFRQVAAAHGRSMEEHLRQMVIEADFGNADLPAGRVAAGHVAEVRQTFHHEPSREDNVRELIRIANGSRESAADTGKYAEIRFMTAKDAMAELRRLANGVELDLPPRMNTRLEAPDF
jgi:plasmid stability protein